MSQQTREIKNTGPEAAHKLRTLFEKWDQEDARASYGDEPSGAEIKKALNEGRPADGKPFPEE